MVPFYFNGDPRHCYAPSKSGPFASLFKRREIVQKGEFTVLALPELAARYPEHHLMIFSDGKSLIDRETGQLVDWITQFFEWAHRSLFTLVGPNEWGHREQVLAKEADFLIMPANEAGLKALVEQIHTGTPPRHPILSQKKARGDFFPEYLNEQPHRWTEPRAPEPEILTHLLQQLKSFLGKTGYYWLCACAVYPELHWQLTLFLGDKLLAFVFLPYFR